MRQGTVPQNLTCDGTTAKQTRNCRREVTWQVKRTSDRAYVYAACTLHLSQVGTYLLSGERGDLDVRRIKTEGC
jgi:hypothetical protein